MKYFELSSRDGRTNDYLFKHAPEGADGPLEIKPAYRGLACSDCERFDFESALNLGVDDSSIATRADYFHSFEGELCVSERARVALRAVKGIEFVEIRKTRSLQRYVMLVRAQAVVTKNWLTPGPICRKCGRLREATGSPSPDQVIFPADVNTIFAFDCPPERYGAISRFALGSQLIADIFHREKLRGVIAIRFEMWGERPGAGPAPRACYEPVA